MKRWRTTITVAAGIVAALAAIAGLSAVAVLREWLFLPIVVAALVVIGLLARWHRCGEELAASMRRHPSGKAFGRAAVPRAAVPPADTDQGHRWRAGWLTVNILTFLVGAAAASHITSLRRDRNRWRTSARRLGALGMRQAAQIRRQNIIVQEQAAEMESLRADAGSVQRVHDEYDNLLQVAGQLREQAQEQRDAAVARLALLENKDTAQLLDDLANQKAAIERYEQQAERYRAEIADLEGKLSGRVMAAQTRPVWR